MPISQLNKNATYWFLGACYSGIDDQLDRFLAEGIWQNGYRDKYLEDVRSIQVGDKVAIKSAYTQKYDLPFDNRGLFVSVMAIKAIGTVTRNHGDGINLDIDWQKLDADKKWYFYTNRTTIWPVTASDWRTEQLINFTFYNGQQDIDRFRNSATWRSRFGDITEEKKSFKWTRFYEAIADNLLTYKDQSKRSILMEFVNKLAIDFDLSYLKDKDLIDICPFTALGSFNRGITEENRKLIAKRWADFLGVDVPVPNSFEGIPLLNNQGSWFFSNSDNQQKEINNIWTFYEAALKFADNDEVYQNSFIQAFDQVMSQPYCGWKLTIGLFWIRPEFYVPLDSASQDYIINKLGITIGKNGFKKRCSGQDYLNLLNALTTRFNEDNFPIHSYPELSVIAWTKTESTSAADNLETNTRWQSIALGFIKQLCAEKKSNIFTRQEFLDKYEEKLKEIFPNNNSIPASFSRRLQELRDKNILEFLDRGRYQILNDDIEITDEDIDTDDQEIIIQPIVRERYTINDLVAEGCFIALEQLEEMLERLKCKKNLILQGPPGTGKTWLAKRLANTIIGYKDSNNLRAIQFHPNLSYEDFIRGYRPVSDGKLELVDGPFLEIVNQARKDTQANYVIVIEEINRGNPAQIFGEMLTLLEADKRTPTEALELSYRRENEKGIYIPENLYVIGTMNLADRSLAMVDFALRRRFAFFNLYPCYETPWLQYMQKNTGLSQDLLLKIKECVIALNRTIEEDRALGKAFVVGHSYFTHSEPIDNPITWFKSIINSDIIPLLEAYWLDDLEKVTPCVDKLLASLE